MRGDGHKRGDLAFVVRGPKYVASPLSKWLSKDVGCFFSFSIHSKEVIWCMRISRTACKLRETEESETWVGRASPLLRHEGSVQQCPLLSMGPMDRSTVWLELTSRDRPGSLNTPV